MTLWLSVTWHSMITCETLRFAVSYSFDMTSSRAVTINSRMVDCDPRVEVEAVRSLVVTTRGKSAGNLLLVNATPPCRGWVPVL